MGIGPRCEGEDGVECSTRIKLEKLGFIQGATWGRGGRENGLVETVECLYTLKNQLGDCQDKLKHITLENE